MTRRLHARGSLLMVTLWLIAILAMLSVAIAHHLSIELRLVKYHLGLAQAAALARGGVRYGIALLEQEHNDKQREPEPVDWMGDEWSLNGDQDRRDQDPLRTTIQLGEHQPANEDTHTKVAQVTIQLVDEERKLDLNRASPEALSAFVKELGLPEDIAPAIIAYRDVEQPPEPNEDQADAHPPYYAKDAPMASLDEVLDIPAVQRHIADLDSDTARSMVSILLDESTVYAEGKVNVNTASAHVLKAKKSADPDFAKFTDLIDLIVAKRAVVNGRLGEKDCFLGKGQTAQDDFVECLLGPASQRKDDIGKITAQLERESNVFTITAEGMSESGVSYRIEAVVRRPSGTQLPTVLAWREG